MLVKSLGQPRSELAEAIFERRNPLLVLSGDAHERFARLAAGSVKLVFP